MWCIVILLLDFLILFFRIARHRHIHEPMVTEEQSEAEEAEGSPRRWRDEEESSDEEELDEDVSFEI